MAGTARVTICLPTYERATYLRAAIDSALVQTMPDFVISIGDNSRTDDTEAIVRSYDDPRIRYTRHPKNLGQQGNWLWLIDHAETPFVASLHDDDVWCPNFLEDLLPVIEADPEVSMVFSDYDIIDDCGEVLTAESEALRHRSHRDVLPAGRFRGDLADHLRLVAVWNAPQPAYCAILRRDAVVSTGFPPEIDPVYDIWLSYQIARRGEAFAYVPGVHTYYRWHQGSSTSTGWAEQEDEIFSRLIVENHELGPVVRELERAWAEIRWGRGVRLMTDPTRCEESRRYLRPAVGGLRGPRRVLASVASQSPRWWSVMSAARERSWKVRAG